MNALPKNTRLNSAESLEKASLYIHFPFCARKCAYCDFVSEDRRLERIPAYADALIREIEIYGAARGQKTELKTLYFGGGTPNLFGVDNFRKVMRAIRGNFYVEHLEEITVEINPGISVPDFLKILKEEGVNRVSVGCQSFNSDELKTLERIHSIAEITSTLVELERTGFTDFSLDFIYGIPGQTLASWRNTLEQATQTKATHLSLYCLGYESGTPLFEARESGKVQPLEDELEWQMYALAHQILEQAGFVHYEISNWAKPGFMAKHNSVYWKGGAYFGLGPAAHSFDGIQRWWNKSSIDEYIADLRVNQLPVENREALNQKDKITEALFLGLRTMEGLEIGAFERLSGLNFGEIWSGLQVKLPSDKTKLVFIHDGYLRLTPRGWFICDTIIENILTIIEE